ncbi:hypothetical protein COCSUDRAFT_67899 [Coccomyxa subellipsoidea C-169]|uniref:Sugar phosphate transporter domain-containing protein n=1 Tax=Coccomyxa subellipsoidea (strain C-169) TaxID=574566 RepID=I0YM25_COCSC|nr:hypothetical protein COCSUDRAFT_67899 [Coccomyxa subellipsoidea C-169]EIE19444.1 hypothetical protein COCSUDRAFT_67899 [Coccomyxa subellipsoidea C-169]|eukprot:XP_005643988.1 hypothetical protein COCSUDRAFT_67899 [Coccomyxa subellipsoidea C-169]
MQTRQRSSGPITNGKSSTAYVNGNANGTAAAMNEKTSLAKPVVVGAALSVSSLVLYLLSSSYIILLNKRLMVDDGFKYPLALTGLAQLAGAIAGWITSKTGLIKLGPAPSLRFLVTRLLPIVLSSAGALYFGNMAYLSLSVAFIQILKVLTPAVTLAICATFGLERLTGSLLVSILMITLGTGVATAVEVGVAGFAWPGFISFLFSTLLEAVRVVYIQLLLGSLNYNSMEVLVYLGFPTGMVLLAASAIWEREGLLANGLALMAHKPLHYLSAIFMGFLVNLSTAFAIKVTGSLTFKVVGCVKNTLLVWAGILMGDVVTTEQLLGYTISVVGFALYTHAKWRQGKSASAAKKVS